MPSSSYTLISSGLRTGAAVRKNNKRALCAKVMRYEERGPRMCERLCEGPCGVHLSEGVLGGEKDLAIHQLFHVVCLPIGNLRHMTCRWGGEYSWNEVEENVSWWKVKLWGRNLVSSLYGRRFFRNPTRLFGLVSPCQSTCYHTVAVFVPFFLLTGFVMLHAGDFLSQPP